MPFVEALRAARQDHPDGATLYRAPLSSRDHIAPAAVTAAHGKEAEIHVAASESSPMSMFAAASTATLNPVNSGGLGDVSSPEQPPVAP